MRKIVFTMSVSLDGFMEGPNREIDWHLVDDELHTHMNEWIRDAGGILSGRRTHQLMVEFWPTADQDPANAGPVAEFAGIWRDMPKYVFSRTLDRAEWSTRVLRDVVPEEIMELKAQPGGDLIVGGADLAETFLRHDLIDQYRIYIHPIILGRGKRTFPPLASLVRLRTMGTETFGNGVVLLRYQRVEP